MFQLELGESSKDKEMLDNTLINEHLIIIPDIEQKLNNWNIPELNVSKIYKTSIFDRFYSDYLIRTSEYKTKIDKLQDSLDLFSEAMLKDHKRKYEFLHIGSIQVAIKPLYRLGIDTPVCICLRDTRPYKFEDQVLSIIETNLHDGPKYFNNYPNYTIALDSLGKNKHNIKS